MTKKRLNWAETFWTIHEDEDGDVIIVPDDKENLQYYWTDEENGIIVHDDLFVSYTKKAWEDQIESQVGQDHYEFWLVDELNNQISDRYLRMG